MDFQPSDEFRRELGVGRRSFSNKGGVAMENQLQAITAVLSLVNLGSLDATKVTMAVSVILAVAALVQSAPGVTSSRF